MSDFSGEPGPRALPPQGEDWFDVRRVEAWAGELRVNLIRLTAIALFYGRHLVEYWLADADAKVRGVYHARVTFVCAAWFGVALALHIVLTRRRMPWWLSYTSVAWDAAMITILCTLTADARTPLVLLFFVLIANGAAAAGPAAGLPRDGRRDHRVPGSTGDLRVVRGRLQQVLRNAGVAHSP
jgi:peptidoglycan/LPS O-acetylase OafA/YrhL